MFINKELLEDLEKKIGHDCKVSVGVDGGAVTFMANVDDNMYMQSADRRLPLDFESFKLHFILNAVDTFS